jgi:hypothetical protein
MSPNLDLYNEQPKEYLFSEFHFKSFLCIIQISKYLFILGHKLVKSNLLIKNRKNDSILKLTNRGKFGCHILTRLNEDQLKLCPSTRCPETHTKSNF